MTRTANDKAHGFSNTHPTIDVVRLRNVPDTLFHHQRLREDIRAQHRDAPNRGTENAHEHLHRCRLARPVWSDQAKSASADNTQREISDGCHASELFREIHKLNGRIVVD